MALFTYGSGCGQKLPSSCGTKSPLIGTLSRPVVNNVPSGDSTVELPSAYETTVLGSTHHPSVIPNNTAVKRTISPSPTSAPLGHNDWDKNDSVYGTLRRESHTLKAVPPPTVPVTSTPSLTRAKKTVTICDTAEIGRAITPPIHD